MLVFSFNFDHLILWSIDYVADPIDFDVFMNEARMRTGPIVKSCEMNER